ncbi:hypothetical protein ACFQUU_27750 [Herbaspirillum sp. GCM10030257]|uniref:hypothetical protein n=1 Tax=Herbaspirillum sp. GCM10030257 TaxID=3273393 RepID=UPI0036136B32
MLKNHPARTADFHLPYPPPNRCVCRPAFIQYDAFPAKFKNMRSSILLQKPQNSHPASPSPSPLKPLAALALFAAFRDGSRTIAKGRSVCQALFEKYFYRGWVAMKMPQPAINSSMVRCPFWD